MAESKGMTSAGVVAKALVEEHSDFLRESVAMIATEIMEAEIERQIGAGKGEVSEVRSAHRNGYRPRPWATRVGEIELAGAQKALRRELLPELPGASPDGREGPDGGDPGSLHPGHLDTLGG